METLAWENRSVEDAQVSYPLGKDATGYIMYNEDGYVFVAIMTLHRLRFAADDLLSLVAATSGSTAASYWIGPSTSRSGRLSWTIPVATLTFSTSAPAPEVPVE